MTREVKQGVPLSPLLFNIAMDPLLAEVSRQGNGYKFGHGDSDRIESLAYADDNCLLTGSAEDMNTNLAIVDRFCAETGMKLNVKKSARSALDLLEAELTQWTRSLCKWKQNLHSERVHHPTHSGRGEHSPDQTLRNYQIPR